jgi:peptidoglycan/xylan/chitin deacetylase (PgdA/CDA1 family)
MANAAASFASGVAVALGGKRVAEAVTAYDPLPLAGGPAPTTHADRRTPPKHSHVEVVWAVDTRAKLVALTFDDGPRPQWTSQVLDTLDEHRAPATFFMVGRRVHKYAHVIAGRLGKHEVGNHTWDHIDLAKRDFSEAHDDIKRAHVAIKAVTGQEARLLRPPYGHLGGSTLLAAADMGYDLALWSLQMLESTYRDKPPALVDYIVNETEPGTIMLAHDVGEEDRLIALRQLPQMIGGLRRRGFEFVTVSQLREAASTSENPAA